MVFQSLIVKWAAFLAAYDLLFCHLQFMPKTNDSLIVTGAADYTINLHDVKLHETVNVCSCHTSRVKRLAVCPDSPHMYWSASEDGTVRYDKKTSEPSSLTT